MVYSTNINRITTSTTLSTLSDVYLIDASGGNITITLPLITADGTQYTLTRIDTTTNTVTIQGTSGQTLNGVASIALFKSSTISLQSFGVDVGETPYKWYTTTTNVNAKGSTLPYNTIFSTQNGSFISSNSTTPTDIGTFFTLGSNIDGIPSLVKAVMSQAAAGTSQIRLTNLAGTQTYAQNTLITTLNNDPLVVTLTLGPDTWPTGETPITILINKISGGASRMFSLHIS